MMRAILAQGGIMVISTREDINVLYSLLETLSNLQIIFTIDKMHVNTEIGKCHVTFIHGLYATNEVKDES